MNYKPKKPRGICICKNVTYSMDAVVEAGMRTGRFKYAKR